MKKWLLVAVLGLFLAGCGKSAVESEFWQHPSVYRNWDHTFFSWKGYKNPSADDFTNTQSQDWWGILYPRTAGN